MITLASNCWSIYKKIGTHSGEKFCYCFSPNNTDSYWDLILKQDELTRLCGPEAVSKLESNANAMRLQSNVEEAKSWGQAMTE